MSDKLSSGKVETFLLSLIDVNSVSFGPTFATLGSATMTATKHLSRTTKAPVEVSLQPWVSVLQQAEICREQARDAARLKRFRAAFGLFSTAAALCRHVFTLKENDENTKNLAAECLHQIDIEMATYAELARASNFKS